MTSGAFWGKVGFSAARILGGMLAAYVLALVLATLSHASTAVRALVRVPLAAIKSTPVVCVVVLLLIWLGSANVGVSSGMMSVRRSMMSAHRPRSTGDPLRTIHRRNMHTRLQADCVLRGTTVLASCSAK